MRLLSPFLPLVVLTALSSTVRAEDPGAPETTLQAGRILPSEFSIDVVTLALVEADGPDLGGQMPPSPRIASVAAVPERRSLGMNIAGGLMLAGLGLLRNRRVASAGCFSGARRIRSPNS